MTDKLTLGIMPIQLQFVFMSFSNLRYITNIYVYTSVSKTIIIHILTKISLSKIHTSVSQHFHKTMIIILFSILNPSLVYTFQKSTGTIF